MNWFVIGNYAEAILWFALAIGLLIYGNRKGDGSRKGYIAGAVLLVLFGVSDIVKAQTGAWWRPWWLFVWKAVCVAALLGLMLLRRSSRAAEV